MEIKVVDMDAFKARFGDQANVIRIARDYPAILGVGVEYLVSKGKIIARFVNGQVDPNYRRRS